MARMERYPEYLVLRLPPIAPDAPCLGVHRRFADDKDLLSIAVVDDGTPVGLVNRHEFLLEMSHLFGRALYDKRPIGLLMDKTPLIVDKDETVTALNARILGEKPAALLQGFIIVSGGRYIGVGTPLALLKATTAHMARKAAELRDASHRAEEANRAKSQFLATMTHELRTPLNAILGFSELIRDQHFGPVGDDRYADYAGDIHVSGQHLLRIIHDVLDMARIDAGKVALQEETLSVERSIAETLRLVQPQAVQARVDLCADADRHLPLLRADPVRIKQVLLNLLINAIKFTGAGGVVTIRARRDGDGGLMIAIADTGVGIPADKLDLVLEPFSQAHQDHGSSAQGSGLGLPISKSLMELHGGTLTIASVEGTGTTVTIRLPAERVAVIGLSAVAS
jgi:signal transduction histidine kinase